jgi:hypothetical protein
MRARRKLGQLLAEVERATHPGKGKVASASLTSLLKQLALPRQTAMEAERIGRLPDRKPSAQAKAMLRARSTAVRNLGSGIAHLLRARSARFLSTS